MYLLIGFADVLWTLWATIPSPRTPAFRGAQGGGAAAVGGRGGKVYEVTNLNETGTGSLRGCVEASGPRTCVFRVGGTITLHSSLHALNPYITIAGQTAPGGGIQITNSSTCNVSANCDLIRIGTHDVIVRYLRARLSPDEGTNYSSAVSILNERAIVYNVMIDHVSTAWAEWDSIDFFQGLSESNFYNISVQWTILAEPNYATNGGVNFPIGGTNAICDASTDIDIHHNYFTGGNHRNPIHAVKSGRIINNLIYNSSYYMIKVKGNKDIIGNYIRKGPYWTAAGPSEIQSWTAAGGTTALPSLYIVGNAADSNSFNPNANQWTGGLTGLAPGEDNSDSVTCPISTTYQRLTPLAAVGAAISVDPTLDIAASNGVLLPDYPNSQGNPGVGASAKLNDIACDGTWVSNRDSLDKRYVNEFLTGTGHSKDVTGPGTLPTLAAGTPCADSDHDGMPDAWEIAHGLNPKDPSDGPKLNRDGYTNLEHFLNGGHRVRPLIPSEPAAQ
jgi:pectate lyase